MTPRTPDELIGFLWAFGLIAGIAVAVSLSRLRRRLKLVIYAALTFRVIGSWLRFTILFDFYGGSGDARLYYARGLEYAERFTRLDFSPFYDPDLWLRGEWWGTSFISFPSGIVLTGIGPSLLGEFVIFSLFAFLGLVGFALAFRNSYPRICLSSYARWIWLFPSLWYWPSSVGKDAVILMGMGLAVVGFFGRRGRINWLFLAIGLFFVFAIRPQVAAVVILSFILAHWLSFGSRWTIGKTFQGGFILAAGLGGIWLCNTYIGVSGFDVEGVRSYLKAESEGAALGGSAIDNVEVGLSGIPMAMLNILFRPFVWEAHNIMALLAALEILGFWIIVWYRRKNLREALRTWRSHPMLRMAVPFILVYSIALGMLIVNLGIISRQRIFLFPFLFLLLEAAPATRRVRARIHYPASSVIEGAGAHLLRVGRGSARAGSGRPCAETDRDR